MAKLALLSILRRFNGWNNGSIAVSYRQFAHDNNLKNQAWIARAIAQLIQHGFIVIETEGKLAPRHAREYRITFAQSGPPGRVRPATNEYKNWKP